MNTMCIQHGFTGRAVGLGKSIQGSVVARCCADLAIFQVKASRLCSLWMLEGLQ